jgi:hypothetical protein
MGKIRKIANVDVVIKCVGYANKYSTDADATKDCVDNCYFCDYGYGDHWTKDWLVCTCPVTIMPGDKYRIKKSYTIEKLN